MKRIASLLLIFCSLSACSDNCVTCTSIDDNILEFCDEEGVSYTDINGVVISFNEIDEVYEMMGWECQE